LKGGEQNVTVLTVFGVGRRLAISIWQLPVSAVSTMFQGLSRHLIATAEPVNRAKCLGTGDEEET
jgi:hypothetical protein